MTRIKDTNTGLVHYVCPAHGGHTLCARTGGTDLLGNFVKQIKRLRKKLEAQP